MMDFALSPRDRAIRMLNYRKPQHPPDIYYIRRNPDLFQMYRDPREYQKLKDKAPQCNRHMYELFDLDHSHQQEDGLDLHQLGSHGKSRRTLINKNDPYFTMYSNGF